MTMERAFLLLKPLVSSKKAEKFTFACQAVCLLQV